MCCFKRSLITRVGVKRRPPGLGNLWLFAPGVGEGGGTRTLSHFVLYQDPLSLIPHDLLQCALSAVSLQAKQAPKSMDINIQKKIQDIFCFLKWHSFQNRNLIIFL